MPERQVLKLDPNDLESPNWMLTLDGDRLQIERRVAWVVRTRRAEAAQRPRAGGFTIKDQMAKTTWYPGDGILVSDGFIFGFDKGEFGGGLHWFSPDGKRHTKISDDNTPLVYRTSKGVFAVQALSHMMFWYGRLVHLERSGMEWKTRLVTDLHLRPGALVQIGDRLLYTTPEYVSTLETDGRQREIYRAIRPFRTESMVCREDGEVWIGSSHGVLRLTPKLGDEGYASQWFLPIP